MVDVNCDHPSFRVKVDVNRITQTEGGKPAQYEADISVQCDVCEMPFRFLCPQVGLAHDRPMRSVDGLELRAPIYPNDGSEPLPPKLKGFTVTQINP